jgi:hypothetical protein
MKNLENKRCITLAIFLCFFQFTFAGWTTKGTYFKVHDQSGNVIISKWYASGAKETNTYEVVFTISDLETKNVELITYLNLSTLNGDAIDRSKQSLVGAILIKNIMYFFDGYSNLYSLNLSTKKIEKLYNFKEKYGSRLVSIKTNKGNLIFISQDNSIIIEDTFFNKTKNKIKVSDEILSTDIMPENDFFTIKCVTGETYIYDSNSYKIINTISNTSFANIVGQNKLAYINRGLDSLVYYDINKKKTISKVKYFLNSKFDNINSIILLDNRYLAIERHRNYNELDIIDIINIKSGLIYKTIENKKDERFLDDGTNPIFLGYKDKFLNFYLIKRGNSFGLYENYNIDISSLFSFKEDNNGPIITFDQYKNYTEKIFKTSEEVILLNVAAYDDEQKSSCNVIFTQNNREYEYMGKGGIPLSLKKGINIFPFRAEDKYGNSTETKFIIERVAKTRGSVGFSKEKSIEEKIASYNYKALLISNQNYSNGIDSLQYPIRDALKLKAILETQYSFKEKDIIHIIDATRSQIINTLDSLASTITQSDNLLIFYAGHGVFDENLQKGYWLPIDANPEKKSNWVSNSDIQDYLTSFKSQHTLLITDACFSGSIFEYGKRNLKNKAMKVTEKLLEKKSRKAMTSGLNKPVPDESIFIKYLLKELEKNKKSFIRAGELYNEIREAVMSNTDNNPQFEIIKNAGHEGGEFIFLKKD